MKNATLLLAMLCIACIGHGQQLRDMPAASMGQVTATEPPEYVIRPDDVLEVYLLDVPEMSRQYRVSPGGGVSLPLLDKPIVAAGRTLDQFAEAIKGELIGQGLVSRPQVTVSLRESRLASVAITGAVRKPQIYPVFGRTTILDVLAQSEGLTEDAGNVAIVRRGSKSSLFSDIANGDGTEALGPERSETVDLKLLLESGNEALNVEIYPGDRVTVPRAGIVYVVGAVNRPGGFPLKSTSGSGMTVLQALAMAEDMKSTAMKDKAVLIRSDATGARTQTSVNLGRVLSGKAADPVVHADDILFIPDSSSKKMLRRGAEAIVQAATGVMVYRR